jgi:hypothetical protein
MDWHCPLFDSVRYSQIHQLSEGFFIWKYSSFSHDFSNFCIVGLNDIGCVDELSDDIGVNKKY